MMKNERDDTSIVWDVMQTVTSVRQVRQDKMVNIKLAVDGCGVRFDCDELSVRWTRVLGFVWRSLKCLMAVEFLFSIQNNK